MNRNNMNPTGQLCLREAARICLGPKSDPLLDARETRLGGILLAAAVVGPSADKIAKLLGYPNSKKSKSLSRDDVRYFAREARKAKIWVGHHVTSDYFESKGAGAIALICDVLCLDGKLNRVSARRISCERSKSRKIKNKARKGTL